MGGVWVNLLCVRHKMKICDENFFLEWSSKNLWLMISDADVKANVYVKQQELKELVASSLL